MRKITFKNIVALLTAAVITVMFAGCQEKQEAPLESGSKNSFPVIVTDVYGNKITIEKKPEKIVALAPSIVEVLYKLGLEDSIVGVTDFCDYPQEANTKTKVGGFNGVSIEKVLELKPDLVLAGSGSKEVFEKLADLKINVLVVEARTMEQITDTFMMIGKAVGAEDKAKAFADEVTGRINNIKEKVKGANKVKSYYVLSFGKEGNWTGGRGTFMSELINMAGGENIADDTESWVEYSTEKLVEKNPDIILLSDMVANGNKDILDTENGYKETNAVKNDKVMIMDDNLVQRPGPRIADGLELIAKAIHPEIFDK